jgi:Bacterial protein of unknown function (DUF899)
MSPATLRRSNYLHSRDATYARFCQGPNEESIRYRDFMGWENALVLGRPGLARHSWLECG